MTVTVSGIGTFEIPNDKLPQLMAWLEANSVRVLDNSQNKTTFDGNTLITG